MKGGLNMKDNWEAYEDIINLPRPEPVTHPRMPMSDRAAQFSPFAALSGYGDAVNETARLTDGRIHPGEDSEARIDENLKIALTFPETVFEITYFVKDRKKAGGKYVTVYGSVSKFDSFSGTLTLNDGTIIPVKDVVEAEKCGLDGGKRDKTSPL